MDFLQRLTGAAIASVPLVTQGDKLAKQFFEDGTVTYNDELKEYSKEDVSACSGSFNIDEIIQDDLVKPQPLLPEFK